MNNLIILILFLTSGIWMTDSHLDQITFLFRDAHDQYKQIKVLMNVADLANGTYVLSSFNDTESRHSQTNNMLTYDKLVEGIKQNVRTNMCNQEEYIRDRQMRRFRNDSSLSSKLNDLICDYSKPALEQTIPIYHYYASSTVAPIITTEQPTTEGMLAEEPVYEFEGTEEVSDDIENIRIALIEAENKFASQIKSKVVIHGSYTRYLKFKKSCFRADYQRSDTSIFKYAIIVDKISCTSIPSDLNPDYQALTYSSVNDVHAETSDEVLDNWENSYFYRRRRSIRSKKSVFNIANLLTSLKSRLNSSSQYEYYLSDSQNNLTKVPSKYFRNILSAFRFSYNNCTTNNYEIMNLKMNRDFNEIFIHYYLGDCYMHLDCGGDKIIETNGSCVPDKNKVHKSLLQTDAQCSLPETKALMEKYYNYERSSIIALNKDICGYKLSLNGEYIPLKECTGDTVMRKAYILKFGMVTQIMTSLSMKDIYDLNTITSYDCPRECSDGNCLGDDIYLSNFGSDLTNKRSDYCTFDDKRAIKFGCVGVGDQCFGLSCYMFTSIIVSMKPNAKSLMIKQDKSNEDASETEVHCDDKGVYIKSERNKIKAANLCYHETCIYKFNLTKETYIGPLIQFHLYSKNRISVNLFYEYKKEIENRIVLCPQLEYCDLLDCKFCVERWQTIRCFGFFEWIVFLILIIIILMLARFLLKLLYSVLSLSLKFVLLSSAVISKVRKSCCGVKADNSKLEKIVVEYKPAEQEIEDESVMFSKPVRTGGIRRPRIQYMPLVILTVTMMLVQVQTEQCTEVKQLDSTTSSCNKATNVCKLTTNMRFIINDKSTTICLNYHSLTKQIATSMVIKVISTRAICDKEFLYYFTHAEGICHSKHNCAKAGLCFDNHCENYKNVSDIKDFSSYSKTLGITRCTRICGCAGCGCFLCSQSCMYYFAGFKTHDSSVYRVEKCKSWSLQLIIDVSLLSNAEKQVKRITIQPGITKSAFGADFTIISRLTKPISDLKNCFVTNEESGLSALIPCSDKDLPIKGTIGEIQCDSPHTARMLDSDHCIMADNLFSVRTSSYATVCDFSIMNPNKLMDKNLLPLRFENGIITKLGDDFIVSANEKSITELQVDIEAMDVNLDYTTSKCSLENAKLEGCYSCKSGAKLTGTMFCDKADSIVQIECPSLSEAVITTGDQGSKDVELMVNFQASYVNELCTLKSSGGESTFRVKGTLHHIGLINVKDNSIIVDKIMESEHFNLGSIFQSSWFKTISIILITFIVLIIFLAILFICKR